MNVIIMKIDINRCKYSAPGRIGGVISNRLFAFKPGMLYMEKRILFRRLAIVDYNIYFSTAFGLINHSN